MPLPLDEQASSAHRFWLPVKPSTLGAHNTPCTHSCISETARADTSDHFSVTPPKASFHLPGPSPQVPAQTPGTQSRSRTSGSQLLAFAPSALENSERPLFSSLNFHPLPHTHTLLVLSSPSPQHPLRTRLTCAATPVPALVRLLQLEGDRSPEWLQTDPGGASGHWWRAAPPETPRPSAPRPPGTSASAARCGPGHGPPGYLPPQPHGEPHTAPNPRGRYLSALQARTGPLGPEFQLADSIPGPPPQKLFSFIQVTANRNQSGTKSSHPSPQNKRRR